MQNNLKLMQTLCGYRLQIINYYEEIKKSINLSLTKIRNMFIKPVSIDNPYMRIIM